MYVSEIMAYEFMSAGTCAMSARLMTAQHLQTGAEAQMMATPLTRALRGRTVIKEIQIYTGNQLESRTS